MQTFNDFSNYKSDGRRKRSVCRTSFIRKKNLNENIIKGVKTLRRE